ncbi:DoxX family protein [Aeoliella sp. SH292]|uniref:DoxX family protein n=1 Tax=Aeoliella sp. SH292 TaxID=3454464 RepID=UPI003F96D9C8
MANNGYRITAAAAITIVALRLIIGWHFFTAGVEKFEPGWSSASYLRLANGPLEGFYKSMAPLPHEWDKLVLVQLPAKIDHAEEWRYIGKDGLQETPYKAAKDDKMPDGSKAVTDTEGHIPFPTDAYGPWASRIATDWTATTNEFKKIDGLTEEQIAAADKLLEKQLVRLSQFFELHRGVIDEYHHEIARLEEMLNDDARGELPYLDERITKKRAEVAATPRPWAADIQAEEDVFYNQLRGLVKDEQLTSAMVGEQLAGTFNPPTRLQTVDKLATGVTLGVGICLILGLFTRLASVIGAGFLLSIMSMQPPWAEGVLATVKLLTAYQGIEFFALLLLAAIGAGTWAGLDGVFFKREE